ncbi:MAG: Flagellar protein FlbB [Alphaproteobacteria bacterium]|jgi:flagellar motility protein MotE (MotC chaperone)|nr:Flagellar protein FlbB [Alphaproteobacteria bacterium]
MTEQKKKKRWPFSIFSALMVVAGVAFAFRLVNVVTVIGQEAGLTRDADAQETVNENPPPLTKEELQKAVADTARQTEELPDAATPATTSTPPASTAQANPPPPDDEDTRAYTASEVEVLQSLSKRRDELDKRERMIGEREALLTAAGQEVDHKIAELNRLKGEIEALLGKQQTMEEERLVSLVKIYEGMKPKEAATIFNTLDLDVLLEVIGRMNERKASPILAAMDPDKARIVTIRLSEKEKLPVAAPAGKPSAAAPAETPLNLPNRNAPTP